MLKLPPQMVGKVWFHEFRDEAIAPHHHDELELNLITRGRATYLLRDAKYSLAPGDAIWLFPEQDHVLLDQSADFAMWIMIWKPEVVQAASTLIANETLKMLDPTGNFHRGLSERQARRLSLLCEEVRNGDIDCMNAGLPYLLLRAWTEFNAADRIAVGEDIHPCVERAARLLRDGQDAGLEVLARKVGLSASRLSRLFKEQTGMPLAEFRNRQRLERFFQLYGNGQRIGLSEAALDAGFGSYAQFFRVYRRLVGASPGSRRRAERSSGSSVLPSVR